MIKQGTHVITTGGLTYRIEEGKQGKRSTPWIGNAFAFLYDFSMKSAVFPKKFGADIVLNPSKVDVIKKIKDLTDGYGCDVYIEATGHPSSVQQGLEAIRKMGTFVEFSVFGELTTVDWSIISDTKELDLFGAHLSPFCYEPVIEWIANGKLPTEGVVTHKLPLEDYKKAFELAGKGEGSLKVVLVP